jgi:hypothetical protein
VDHRLVLSPPELRRYFIDRGIGAGYEDNTAAIGNLMCRRSHVNPVNLLAEPCALFRAPAARRRNPVSTPVHCNRQR